MIPPFLPVRPAPRRTVVCLIAFSLLAGLAGAQPAATPSPPAAAAANSETLQMNAVGVQASADTSYAPFSATSLTSFNTALDRLPLTADIFDAALVKDSASTSVEQMIEAYSAGAGYAAADPAGGAASLQPGDRNNASLSLRGLGTPVMQRDGFMPVGSFANPGSTGVGFSSNFDVERTEIINGPQSVLYVGSGAGGVINTVSKQARFGQPAFGSVQFQVDQYGNRLGLFDYGVGTDQLAARVAILDQTVGGRRTDIGGPAEGYYGQFASKLFGSTTVRLVGEQTAYNRIGSTSQILTAASTSNDSRNGDYLHFLLATGQTASARSGASGAGPIDNLLLNWGNVDSLAGWWAGEETVNAFGSLTAETQWAPWLSTRVTVAYDHYSGDLVSNTLTFYPPNNPSNPLGVWAIGMTGSNPNSDTEEPDQTKGIQVSALATNDVFAGRIHSQTLVGADFIRTDAGQIAYDYFQADSGFHVLVTPANAAALNNGRTVVPKTYWPVAQGPIRYPLWGPRTPDLTYNGVNYVRQIASAVSPALIGPGDPTGTVAGGTDDTVLSRGSDRGAYALNYSQWLDGKLDTLAGVRLSSAWQDTIQQTAPVSLVARSSALDFDAGADYAALNWLRPFLSISDSYNPPAIQATDPYGQLPQPTRALGEEVGVKLQNEDTTVSGSIGIYHIDSRNELSQISSTLTADINPSGLNGRLGSPNNAVNLDRTSNGLQAVLTAAPTPDWRLRLSAAAIDGRIGSTTSYGQLYNDQFYENSAGQVTYADGAVVYVTPTFNSKKPTSTSATAGAIPLTVAAMSTAGNTYFANPVAITGQINSGTNVATVLRTVDPAHGAILTGAVGLPISDLQINPGFTPPGKIVTSQAGDVTVGYPEFSLNFTDVYTVPSGWARGLRLGETIGLGWRNRSYYYYPNGVSPGAAHTLFAFPDLCRFDLILGYSRKLKRVTWSTQVNATNLFNRYHIVILPNATTGYAGPDNATFDQQPRTWAWTNTLAF